jgi:hypothetical protein
MFRFHEWDFFQMYDRFKIVVLLDIELYAPSKQLAQTRRQRQMGWIM